MNRLNGTRFMSQEELVAQLSELDMTAEIYPIGGIPLLVKENKIYVDATDSHSMIFGATGSKKTRMFAMPSIGIFARAGESFVVTDPKGELYKRTIGDVKAHDYECYCLNLRDFRVGVTWNPLALPYKYYHNGKKAKAMEFVNEMAKMIIGEDAVEEAFWVNTGIDVFCGLTLLLFEKAAEMECHLKSLIELWNSYLKDRKKTMEMIKENYGNSMIYQKLSSLDCSSERTVGSIESFITMGLNKLSINEEFIEFLSQEGMNLEEVTDKKTAIYLVIPDENKSYHFVASLFLEQLYEILIGKAQREKEQKLAVRMNFLIDEFANIPKIENMDAMITAARSRNIRFHLIVQGMKQLQQKYGAGADIISGNCNNWIYLYSKEYELLQEISRLCGEVIYDNNVRMPLFSEFDLQHLNKEEGEALVLVGRNCPCLSNLADIDAYAYPILETENCIEAQPWKKVHCFSFQGNKKLRYFCEKTDWLDILDIKKEEERRWLVAVGADGMILAEGTFSKWLVDTKDAIGAMICGVVAAKKLEADLLEWYSAEESLKRRYMYKRLHCPENVYVTLEELGIEKFKLEKEADRFSRGTWQGKDYEVTLTVSDEKEPSKVRAIFRGKVNGYKRKTGECCSYNLAFRKANRELKGTKYEELPWEYVGNHTTAVGKEVEQFKKKLNERDYVVLNIGNWENVIEM